MGFADTRPAKPPKFRPKRWKEPAGGQHWPAADPWKRAADIILAGIGLLLLLPLIGLIVALIRCDGGPAFFRQRRLGAGGQPFTCLKFRTMRVNAELALLDYLAGNPIAAREWAENCKLLHDPRITSIGFWLRRLSIDELPQLLNVLRGEMSLVGPRPIVPDEAARYGTAIDVYFRARPGLTGLWQISGRSDLPYARRVELDVEYVRGHSLGRDAIILYRTIGAVLRRQGAR